MGNNTSDTLTLSDEIWNRDIEKMFTSAKMTESFDFKAKYLIPISTKNESGEKLLYTFISDTGTIHCLSQILPDIEFTQQIDCKQILNYLILNNTSFALSTPENILVLQYNNTNFDIIAIDIANSQFLIHLNDKNFISITETGNIHLITEGKNQNSLAKLETNDKILNATLMSIDQQILLISTEKSSYMLPLNNPVIKEIPTFSNATKIICDEREVYFTKTSMNGLYKCILKPDFAFSDPENIAVQNEKIVDFVLLTKKAVLVLYQSGVVSYLGGAIGKQISFAPAFSAKSIFLLSKVGFFIVLCKDGHILLCKHPDGTNPAEKNEKKYIELSWLHKCEINLITSLQESSFLTYDANETAILWENLPNWWNAPHFLDMFGERDNTNQKSH